MASSEYQYSKLLLGEVRLITILPDDTPKDVHIEITHTPLTAVPNKYDALSYMWGPSAPRHQIHCKGRILSVSPNLNDALHALRKPDRPFTVWIDELAINQNDVEERGQQVRLMSRIYSGARTVLVWLSSEVWATTNLFDDVVAFSHFATETMRDVRPSATESLTTARRHAGEDTLSPRIWDSVHKLLKNEYFQRVWIVQEVAKAKAAMVMIGGKRMSWVTLNIINAYAYWYPPSSSTGAEDITSYTWPLNRVCTIRNRLKAKADEWPDEPKWTLLSLMLKIWNNGATDSRDKVYSMAGLLDNPNHCVPQEVDPDYTIDHGKLVRSVVIYAITEQSDLKTLLYVRPEEERSDWPSWLPNPDDMITYTAQLTASHHVYHAADSQRQAIMQIDDNLDRLSFRVTRLGTVSKLLKNDHSSFQSRQVDGMTQEHVIDWKEDLQQFWQFLYFLLDVDDLDVDDDFVFENAVRAWQCDTWTRFERFDEADPDALQRWLQLLRWKLDFDEDVQQVFSSGWSIRHDAVACHISASPALQETGIERLFGWLPRGGEIDDAVVLVHGFAMPMLARKNTAGEWRFKGSLYVHGMMDGEAFEENSTIVEDIVVF